MSMHRITTIAVAAGAGAILMASGAHACTVGKPYADLTKDDAQALYECLEAAMHERFVAGDATGVAAEIVADYRDWRLANTHPADPGAHDGRFLTTFVNDEGHAEYVRFLDEGAQMPAGTRIAKESFSVTDEGEARWGPLFMMAKVEPGGAPETDDWRYYMISPGGAQQRLNEVVNCHVCHTAFEGADFLGYPVEEVRVSR